MPSPKQREILRLFRPGFEVTKQTVVDSKACGPYYHNTEKYVGEILSRMVNQGLLERVHPGVFRLPDQPPPRKPRKSETGYDKQGELF